MGGRRRVYLLLTSAAVVYRLLAAVGSTGDLGDHGRFEYGRATPSLGHEGPGATLLTVGGIDMITNGSDAQYGLLGARFVGEETLQSILYLALHRDSVGGCIAAGDSLLASPKGRRH